MPRLLRRTLFNRSGFFALLITLFLCSMFAFAPDSVSVLGALVLPPAARPPAAPARTGCVYWIQPGDDLFRIGLRYGVSYRYLASLNGIPNPNLIFAGTPLAVPCASNPGPVPIATPANCAPSQTYVVQPGNNLFRIALAYGSLVEWIRAANNLYGRVLRPNMQLTIPCPGSVTYGPVPEPPAGVTTVVPPGGAPPPAAPPTETTVPPAPATVPAQPPTAAPTSTSGSVQINVFADHFQPAKRTIPPGGTIAFINQDGANAHTITCPQCAAGSLFDSPDNSHTIPPGTVYQYTFNVIGTYGIVLQENQAATCTITVSQNPNEPSP